MTDRLAGDGRDLVLVVRAIDPDRRVDRPWHPLQPSGEPSRFDSRGDRRIGNPESALTEDHRHGSRDFGIALPESARRTAVRRAASSQVRGPE